MKSKDAQRLFSGYLEGELSAEEEERLRAHFASCPEDREAYREFEATVDLLRSLPREEASPELTAAVMTRVRRYKATGSDVAVAEPRRRSVFADSRVQGVLALAAMLVLGFVSGYAFLSAMGGSPSGMDVARRATESGNLAADGGHAAVSADSQTTVPLWDTFEVPADRPLKQVGSGHERASIVF